MPKQIMEKRGPRRKAPNAQLAVERVKRKNPPDRITAIVMAAEAAGYGCHYGNFVADHPHAFDDWEPGQPMPEIPGKVYEFTCRNCGRKFTTTNGLTRYCGPDCKGKKNSADYRAKHKKEENANV